jgi:hypothetical protein
MKATLKSGNAISRKSWKNSKISCPTDIKATNRFNRKSSWALLDRWTIFDS